MLLFLPEPWEFRKDHQHLSNRLKKSPAYLIRGYSFDVCVDFESCYLSGYSWVTLCIQNNFPAFMNVKDSQGLNVLLRLNHTNFLGFMLLFLVKIWEMKITLYCNILTTLGRPVK